MEKITIKYECCPTLSDIKDFMTRLNMLSPSTMFVKDGTWRHDAVTYTDDNTYNMSTPYSGIGFFEKANDIFPEIIFNHSSQKVYIFADSILEYIFKGFKEIGQKPTCVSLDYEKAFDKEYDIFAVVDNHRQEKANENNRTKL